MQEQIVASMLSSPCSTGINTANRGEDEDEDEVRYENEEHGTCDESGDSADDSDGSGSDLWDGDTRVRKGRIVLTVE